MRVAGRKGRDWRLRPIQHALERRSDAGTSCQCTYVDNPYAVDCGGGWSRDDELNLKHLERRALPQCNLASRSARRAATTEEHSKQCRGTTGS
eukprot:764613-Hanusia_phi.AAC.1